MGEELILLILLAIVVFVCGVALLFACCKKSHGHNHDDPHETSQDLDRTLKSPENSFSLVVDLDAHDFLEGVECVICLSELVDGDIAQVLPNCYHWFHAECIYTWLESESTCPICRVMVGSQPASSVASISSGELVIQIPVVEP